MTATLRLTLPYPPSANKYWRPAPGRGLVPSDIALEYKARVAQLLAGTRPLVGDVVWSGVLYRPRATGDFGNRKKVLEDALEGFAYLDDAQIAEYRNFRRSDADPSNPRVELVLTAARFASKAEAEAAAQKKRELAEMRRQTRNRNRVAKRLNATPAFWRPR